VTSSVETHAVIKSMGINKPLYKNLKKNTNFYIQPGPENEREATAWRKSSPQSGLALLTNFCTVSEVFEQKFNFLWICSRNEINKILSFYGN